jgi:hypothetical protein
MQHKGGMNPDPRGSVWRRLAQWAIRRRRAAARHFLQGVCTGTGTAAVGLVVVWFQSRH